MGSHRADGDWHLDRRDRARWRGGVIGFCGFLVRPVSPQMGQTLFVNILVSCLALVAFYASESQSGNWLDRAKEIGWFQSIRFWIWPCFTFAMTYYLVQIGILDFLMGDKGSQYWAQAGVAGVTAAITTAYCYYLGRRKLIEVQSQTGNFENLQSCPFVMGILKKAGIVPGETKEEASSALAVRSEEVRGRP